MGKRTPQMIGKAARKAAQDVRWSDGKKPAPTWGRSTRQHRAVALTGDSRVAGPTRDRVAKITKKLRKKK